VSELDKIADRLRQNNTARQTSADTAVRKLPVAAARLGCTFCAGERVFDLVTGLEGEVIDGTRENLIVPAAERRNG
jgi:hypothetical protein